MSLLWGIKAAQQARKAKRFWKMINDPQKKQRWLDKINKIRNKNKAKTTDKKTGQKSFDFNEGGEVIIGKNVDKDLL